MSLIAQIWWVVATATWVILALFLMRALTRLHASLDQAEASTEQLSSRLAGGTHVQQQLHVLLLESFYRVQSVRAWTVQIEGIAIRSFSLATLLVDELETPILKLIGVVRGVRSGAKQVLESWANPGEGTENEVEPLERWLDDGGMPPGSVARVGRTRPQPPVAREGAGNEPGMLSSRS